jgi:hypothetical protein
MLWVDQVEGLGNMFAASRCPIIRVIKMCYPAMGRSAPEVPVIRHDLEHLVQCIVQREQLHLPRAVEQQVAPLCAMQPAQSWQIGFSWQILSSVKIFKARSWLQATVQSPASSGCSCSFSQSMFDST